MDFLSFVLENQSVILFYVVIIALIYFNRKKFTFQGKIVALYKTKIGIKLMERYARPLSQRADRIGAILYKLFGALTVVSLLLLILERVFGIIGDITGYILLIFSLVFFLLFLTILIFRQFKQAGKAGIYVGFIGMAIITVVVLRSFLDLFIRPEAPAQLSPFIPGVVFPGSPLEVVPFWHTIIALFIVVVIHEFAHGLLCKVHKIKVKSTGIGMLLILPLAFVEPDEKVLKKAPYKVQQSMFAAGPFSNILTGILFMLLTLLLLSPIAFLATEKIDGGIYFFSLENTSAREAGIGYAGALEIPLDILSNYLVVEHNGVSGENAGTLITTLNGIPISNVSHFSEIYDEVLPGDTIVLGNDESEYSLVTRNESGQAYMGVNIVDRQLKEGVSVKKFKVYTEFLKFLAWLIALSFGLGLANLLPLEITDGGRMLNLFGDRKLSAKGKLLLIKAVRIFILIVIITLIVPLIRGII